MKITIILLFLTIATVKENEACFCLSDTTGSEETEHLMQADQTSYGPRHDADEPIQISKVPWTTTLAKKLRAKPYDIKESKDHWEKDHQFLVPSKEEQFPPKSVPDSEILALQTKVDELLNLEEECQPKKSFKDYYYDTYEDRPDLDMTNSWDAFFAGITNCHMYSDSSDTEIKNLLTDLADLEVDSVENFGGGIYDGTTMKLKLKFENQKMALFKPIRFDHNYETDPNELYFNEMERPNAEVAAFYLDKLLGFRRGVPTVIREFNFEEHLRKHTPTENMDKMKYYTSPGKNLCMTGTCDNYCDTTHAICAVKGKILGSVQAWLPVNELYIDFAISPYKRNYTFSIKQRWQIDGGYCDNDVKHRDEFQNGRRMLDLVDLSIFDYLTGNQDRHGYEWFPDLDEEGSFFIPLDNGRAFGTPHLDDLEILAPLTQCCVVRPSTVNTLLNFYKDGTTSLGRQLEQELENQFGIENKPSRPILARKYLIAIDRRVEIVLKAVVDCVTDVGDAGQVLVNRFDPSRARSSDARRRFISNRMNTKKQDLTVTNNQPQDMHHVDENGVAITRHKRNIDPHRPVPKQSLVNSLNSKLEPFLKADKPCPDEIMHGQLADPMGTSIAWKEFYAEISNCHLYKEGSTIVQTVLKEMKGHISSVSWNNPTQFRATLVFSDAKKAIFKPKRFGRNYETNPNHLYVDDFERHHAEIAAFHLDRLLGFRRVLPTVGRWINVKDDLVDKMHPQNMIEHFVSPVGNDCFYKGCQKYCDQKHPFCGHGKRIEGSVRLTLGETIEGHSRVSVYKKTYKEETYTISSLSAQTAPKNCDKYLKSDPAYHGRQLPDLVELHIFDFLTGNQERNHYHMFGFPGHKPYIFITENGKAFGNPHIHDETILAPLIQCCIVRPSTVKKLLDFYNGEVSLGKQLDNSLMDDELYPILAEKYLTAINFRVEIILRKVEECLEKAEGGDKTVFMNFFPNNEE